MLSVKGRFQNGVVHPNEPIEGREGESVIIVFVEEDHTPMPAIQE
jgi:predicted DNA-binding antitoxin AbrB/MazE fold protein